MKKLLAFLWSKNKMFLVLILSILFVLGSGFKAEATFSFDYAYVQHRVYEDGRDLNRLGFGIKEDGSSTSVDVLDRVRLNYESSPPVVDCDNCWSFGYFNELYGEYDGTWNYNSDFAPYNYYGVNFSPLNVGKYTVGVSFKDSLNDPSIDMATTMDFNGFVNLPVISAYTFSGHTDSEGNVILNYGVPDLTGIIDPKETSVMGLLAFYDEYNNRLGEMTIKVPTDLGYFLIPDEVVSLIESLGNVDRAMYAVQLRTNDNNNRTYSYSVPIDASSPVPEPATMLLLGTGLVGLAGFGRKKFFKNS